MARKKRKNKLSKKIITYIILISIIAGATAIKFLLLNQTWQIVLEDVTSYIIVFMFSTLLVFIIKDWFEVKVR